MNKTNYDLFKEKKLKDSRLRELYNLEIAKFNIAEQIKNRRKEIGLTQIELAKRVKTTQSAIARIENYEYENYSLPKLNEIASALNSFLVVTIVPKKEGKKKSKTTPYERVYKAIREVQKKNNIPALA